MKYLNIAKLREAWDKEQKEYQFMIDNANALGENKNEIINEQRLVLRILGILERCFEEK